MLWLKNFLFPNGIAKTNPVALKNEKVSTLLTFQKMTLIEKNMTRKG